jgi:hypothetical protein
MLRLYVITGTYISSYALCRPVYISEVEERCNSISLYVFVSWKTLFYVMLVTLLDHITCYSVLLSVM